MQRGQRARWGWWCGESRLLLGGPRALGTVWRVFAFRRPCSEAGREGARAEVGEAVCSCFSQTHTAPVLALVCAQARGQRSGWAERACRGVWCATLVG